jgi:hypothetical protein
MFEAFEEKRKTRLASVHELILGVSHEARAYTPRLISFYAFFLLFWHDDGTDGICRESCIKNNR